MQAHIKPIVLTRAKAQAQDFATALRTACPVDIDILIHPLIRMDYTDFELPACANHFVFTSPHGVYAWCARSDLRGPCSVVGEQTALAAQDAGFDIINQFAQVADLMGAKLPKDAHYIRGTQISHSLPMAQTIAYQQVTLPWTGGSLPPMGAIFPVFSHQSARRIIGANLPSETLHTIAISDHAAQPLRDAGLDPKIAKSPDRTGMIDAILHDIKAHR